MSRENMITGQVVLRESSQRAPGDKTDRKLMMVVGVIAVPKHFNLKGEHKYTIAGMDQNSGVMGLYRMMGPEFGKMTETFEEIDFKLLPETGEDLTDEIMGDDASGILIRHGRWRV